MERKVTLLWILNAGIIIALILTVILGRRSLRPKPAPIVTKQIKLRTAPVSRSPVAYNTKRAKTMTSDALRKLPPPRDFDDMFTRFPIDDVGDNMIEKWKNVKPENKEKLTVMLDKQIEKAKGILETTPDDKKAKSLLFMSESMKKMMKNNFNYAFERPSGKKAE